MKTINDIQDEIIEEFSNFDDWMDRYQLLIEYGNNLEAFPAQERNDSNLIDGCQSKVWLACHKTTNPAPTDGDNSPIITYQGDSDAILVKGIVALLIRVLSGHSAREIIHCNLYFIDEIQLREHLSPTRTNGLNAMLRDMRLFALALVEQ